MNPRRNKKVAGSNGLTYKQRQAMVELLKAAHKSFEEVSKALGISSRAYTTGERTRNSKKL